MVAKFQKAAENAKMAGFDGIQIHAGNGFIIDQFLRNGCNKRTDEYGGSYENRCRLLMEILEAVLKVFPRERIGIKISPFVEFQSMSDSDPVPLF